MKKSRASAYARYIKDQIEKAATEDTILIFAEKMVKAKDKEGINLFWDEDEENFLRDYIKYTEALTEC